MTENTEINYYVTYRDDYPSENGDMHAFFFGAYISSINMSYAKELIDSHNAANCLIDHKSRLSDYPVTEEMKSKVRKHVWSILQEINEQ